MAQVGVQALDLDVRVQQQPEIREALKGRDEQTLSRYALFAVAATRHRCYLRPNPRRQVV
jgi:hypothetical protein